MELKIEFTKEYTFEGKKIKEIDLSALENITASDMIKAENKVKANNRAEVLPEMTMEYACWIAYFATNTPVEFFFGLSPKDAIKLKTTIQGFFY